MTPTQQNEITGNVFEKQLDIAKVMAKLTEEGYIPNKNKEQKLQWTVILLGALRNIRLFSQDKQNEFINFYIKLNRL
jgi:hypothetical protein